MKKYIIVVSILVLLGVLFLVLQNKEDEEINSLVEEQQNTEGEENIAPVTGEQKEVKETSLDSSKKGLEVFESAKLGIRFYYPKNIDLRSSTGLSDAVYPVLVSENRNVLTVSGSGLGEYYAEIYRKEKNESFEESILRQFVKQEYRNTVCFVEKDVDYGNNVYLLTFKADNGDAGGWTQEGYDNSEKCGDYSNQLRIFYADEKTGGFYRATRGAHDPSFGDPNSYTWWPKNIEFIR
jgi:hypothetical protein